MVRSKREYKSGSKWCFWRWTYVPSDYITRFHFIKTPWFAICLHWLNAPDPEPFQHDHPVSFLSVIIHGWYKEIRGNEYRLHKWFNFVRAIDKHSIQEVGPNTLTLAFMGPKVREWGFDTSEGWQYWKDYNKRKYD